MAFTEFTAHDYARIDVAGCFGLDKLDWSDRLAWTEENHGRLESLVNKAEEPALYHASVQALRAGEQGQATGYPISLDAAASGLQVLSCLVECEASAKLCGVVSTGHRADAYTTLYQNMSERSERHGRQASGGRKIARNQLKEAMISSIFGSKDVPERVFNYDPETLALFYQTMEEDAPGAWALRNALLALWVPYTESYGFVMPDNFHVLKRIEDTEQVPFTFNDQVHSLTRKVYRGTRNDRSLCANVTHAADGMIVREMHRRLSFDPAQVEAIWLLIANKAHGTSSARTKDKMLATLWGHYLTTGFLSARILDYLDERNFGMVDSAKISTLLMTFPKKSFPIISVHDCFRVHPNHGNALRRVYNQLLSELAGSTLLASIVAQISGQALPVAKSGTIAAKILEADYALS